MTITIISIGIAGIFALLAAIFGLLAFDSGAIKRVWTFVSVALKDTQMDAIIIGLAGSGTFIASAIVTLVRGGAWHPQAFGVGFGALASGLGILFKLRHVPSEEEHMGSRIYQHHMHLLHGIQLHNSHHLR